jgi:hypothetical protein
MYIYKKTDYGDSYNYYNELDYIDGTDCPYKSNKLGEGKGCCKFCTDYITYYYSDDYYGRYDSKDSHTCTFPNVHKLIVFLNIFYKKDNNDLLESLYNFCPIEFFEGLGINGPERRIEPDLIIYLINNNINIKDIMEYLKWSDEEYTKNEWQFIQASILAFELGRIK